jgi:hypothetical protein
VPDPATPLPTTPLEERLRGLRRGLLKLHKTLIESERDGYERINGPIRGSGHFLQLLIGDPWFAWLRPISTLVTRIDELQDADEPATADEMTALVREARELLDPSATGGGLGPAYHAALQRDPAVVLAHGEVARVLTP